MRHSVSVELISFSSGMASREISVGNFWKLFRDLEPELGRAGDQTRFRMFRHEREQFFERSRAQKIFAAEIVARRARVSLSRS